LIPHNIDHFLCVCLRRLPIKLETYDVQAIYMPTQTKKETTLLKSTKQIILSVG
jgi:hypothetical protein